MFETPRESETTEIVSLSDTISSEVLTETIGTDR